MNVNLTNAPTWTPEMNVMVKSMVEAELRYRREVKRAWSRANVSEQAEYVLTALRRNGFGVAEQHTISAGRISRREIERARKGLPKGAPDPDSVTGIG